MKEISAAFVKAQAGFQKAVKSNVNPFYKSKYADLATCIAAVVNSLNENGIALMQITHEEMQAVRVETRLLHVSGETLSGGQLYMPVVNADPQGFASALTYARRNSLMACLGIAAEDDDGQAAANSTKQTQARLEKFAGVIEKAQTREELMAIWKSNLALFGNKSDPECDKLRKLIMDRINEIKDSNAAANA
jgi:hypothetical protein